MKKLLMSFFLVTLLIAFASSCYATDPVEYVKVCSTYNEPDWYYIPGTDVCFNTTTGETREETIGGTWVSHVPSNSGEWVRSPSLECRPGRLVQVGTFTSSDFTLNSHGKYETAPFTLTLKHGEFIAKVLIKGGFDVTARSSFCLNFYDVPTLSYSLLGCQDTALLMDQFAPWSFTPLRSVPPASFTSPFTLVGNNGDSPWLTPFDGTVSCSVCVQRALP